MVGIEVGVSQVTFSNGEVAPINEEVPRDLLIRIADERPYVNVTGDACDLRPAHDIYASAVAQAIDVGSPDAREEFPIAIAVPGWWTPGTLHRVRESLTAKKLDAMLVNDAEAAVIEYRQSEPLPSNVVVVSLRANQVSAVVVKHCEAQPIALPSPILVHEEGGDHLDVAIVQHVVQGLTAAGHTLNSSDPAVLSAARAAIGQCRELRESLSLTITESVSPQFPSVSQRLRIVRSELEEIAAPWADSVVRTVQSVVEQAPGPVHGVLLTGGLAHMPLISQRLSADLALDVYVPDDPTLLVVRGAERLLLAAHSSEHSALETRSLPEPSRHQGASLWGLVRNRVLQWTGPGHTEGARDDTEDTPRDEPDPNEVVTLLDPVEDTDSVGGSDPVSTSGAPVHERLVRQQ